MKSKMPWPPAFMPVIRFDHATGLCGGMLVVKRRNEPCSARRAKFGILPSAINLVRRSGSSPSTPRMIILGAAEAPSACRHDRREMDAAPPRTSRQSDRMTRFNDGRVMDACLRFTQIASSQTGESTNDFISPQNQDLRGVLILSQFTTRQCGSGRAWKWRPIAAKP